EGGRYVTPEEMRKAEARASSYGLDEAALMGRAGAAVADVIEERYPRVPGRGKRRVLVVCGLGNNGGDGLVAARRLAEGSLVRVLLLGTAEAIKTREAAENWSLLGGTVERAEVADESLLLERRDWFEWAEVVLDAVLGTGVRGAVREPLATAIGLINGARCARVAIDVPSGLDPLTGAAGATTVRADITVALHRAKVGLRRKSEYTGEVVVVPIGIRE
ncbi:MAG: NAD(P)H-hydrate epimerase, partial [Nitrososphaerales archaeon]